MKQTLEHSIYHSVLRVSALTLALTLLFVSGVLTPVTKQLTLQTEHYLATAISASAGVAPTELNQITAALTEQKSELDKREASLRERELALGLSTEPGRSGWDTEIVSYINSVLLFIVVSLMALNYVLDWRWRRHVAEGSAQGATA